MTEQLFPPRFTRAVQELENARAANKLWQFELDEAVYELHQSGLFAPTAIANEIGRLRGRKFSPSTVARLVHRYEERVGKPPRRLPVGKRKKAADPEAKIESL